MRATREAGSREVSIAASVGVVYVLENCVGCIAKGILGAVGATSLS